MNLQNSNILLTGGNGFLGGFVREKLIERGVREGKIIIPRSKENDLRDIEVVRKILKGVDIVIHLAGNVGGIGYNMKYPGSLFYDNLMMGTQLIHESYWAGVKKFLGICTVCSYPKYTSIPFKEGNLWDGYPEETNAPYGLAKKSMIVQGMAYRKQYDFNSIFLLPVNLYGPRDNFDPERSHVIPAIIKKCFDAIENNDDYIRVWGDGSVSREFLYVEDCAEAIIKSLERYDKSEPVNIGSGMEIKIKELVRIIAKFTGFNGEIIWDTGKPNGQPRRCMDVTRAESEFGFKARTNFEDGLKRTIDWYREKQNSEMVREKAGIKLKDDCILKSTAWRG
ncbi:GDP-L-fucose synthase [Patescibacteria group bacterium]|nr:GDP-L-fucose synthase [Patescibacteria group bacterium]